MPLSVPMSSRRTWFKPIHGSVTVDTAFYTADNTTWPTADGGVSGASDSLDAEVAVIGAVISAAVFEAVGASVTVDTAFYTADNATWPTADGGVSGASDSLDAEVAVIGAVISAAVFEAVGASVTVDTAFYTADNATWPTADGGVSGASDSLDAIVQVAGAAILVEVATALDLLDATVEAAEVPVVIGGGARYPRRRPLPVYGVGYGILPQLWGEAHGVVGVAGQSAAQLFVRAAAVGACGQAGNAAAVLKRLAVAGKGAVGTRGSGEGMIVKFSGSATGQHDDDEAAVIAFLLAA